MEKRSMARSPIQRLVPLLISLAVGVALAAPPEPPGAAMSAPLAAPPEARFDRVQGVVVEADPQDGRVVLQMPGGKQQTLRVAANASVRTLRNLDERERQLDPRGSAELQPGAWIAAAGLHYSDSPELMAKEIAVFGSNARSLVFEQSNWWSEQAREVADFWIRAQFGNGEIGDASGYRTRITKSGGKRPDSENLQETDTILKMLALIDAGLVASLVVMVIISGYENFVSKLHVEDATDKPDWMGTVDFSGLKLKMLPRLLAMMGGLLGILMMIPLRRALR